MEGTTRRNPQLRHGDAITAAECPGKSVSNAFIRGALRLSC
jgi:hypothetical protein